MIRLRVCLFPLSVLALVVASGADHGEATLSVEPAELIKRTDRIGHEVEVDDRLRYFQIHGESYDEFFLKRTRVPFLLPRELRVKQPPRAQALRVRGVLRREGGRLVCDVVSYELLPNDLARLNEGVAALSPRDVERRFEWVRWARLRGRDFEDKELLRRANEIELAAIRIEAEQPSADPATHWLALARRARKDLVAEPEPSALAHRGFRVQAAAAESAEALRKLRVDIESFFPAAVKPAPEPDKMAGWLDAYRANPYEAYKKAPEPVRTALDRRLLADVLRKGFAARVAEDPGSALPVADEAQAQLPDDSEFARTLLERGLDRDATRVASLRRTEVDALARLYRERLNRPERATALYREWLNDQRRHRLSPGDAEGRLLLASQYQALLSDRKTAADLLLEAAQIDPQSNEVRESLLKLGMRKVNGEWIEAPAAGSGALARADAAGAADPAEPSLFGKTPAQVRERLGGRPDRVVYCASQGQVVEQWIFVGPNENQYVNFVRRSGESQPRVISYYSQPRRSFDAAPAP